MKLKVKVEYAFGGLDGYFHALPSGLVRVSCDDNTPFDLGIVVDNSGSQESVLGQIQRGATVLAEDVISAGGQVSLTRVSTQASSLVDLTSNASAISLALENTKVNRGWTALYDGIRLASEGLGAHAVEQSRKRFLTCRRSKRTAIAVFTDGGDNNSSDEKHGENSDGINTSIDDLIETEHLGSKVPVYTIGMGDKVQTDVLKRLSNETGGMFLKIDDEGAVAQAFERISSSLQESVEVCAALPTGCGPLGVRVTYTYQDGKEIITEQETYETQVSCPAPVPKGRVVTVLMALSDPSLQEDFRRQLVSQSMEWISNGRDKRVLLVLDDNHHGEHPKEMDDLEQALEAAGFTVTRLVEPRSGLSQSDVESYDLVWFTNPGYPVDDSQTVHTLSAHVGRGGGLVLSGDDISRAAGRGFPMHHLTGVKYRRNGVRSCNVVTNNGSPMGFALQQPTVSHPVTMNLDVQGLSYHNDIDHTRALFPDSEVLLWAKVNAGGCEVRTPAVIARDLK